MSSLLSAAGSAAGVGTTGKGGARTHIQAEGKNKKGSTGGGWEEVKKHAPLPRTNSTMSWEMSPSALCSRSASRSMLDSVLCSKKKNENPKNFFSGGERGETDQERPKGKKQRPFPSWTERSGSCSAALPRAPRCWGQRAPAWSALSPAGGRQAPFLPLRCDGTPLRRGCPPSGAKTPERPRRRAGTPRTGTRGCKRRAVTEEKEKK